MSDDLIGESASRIFARHGGIADGIWPAALWNVVEEAGFPLALLTEEQGGFGLTGQEAMTALRISARHAAPIPLAETMAANWMLAQAGLEPAKGPAALVGGPSRAVPFGRYLSTVVIADQGADGVTIRRVALPADARWQQGENIAGEPRDDLAPDLPYSDRATLTLDPIVPQALMAILRAQQMAGAMEGILATCIRYVNERKQFGKPLAKFQVIQQYLAVMASETAAAGAAASLGAAALPKATDKPDDFIQLAAVAKIRAGEAAGQVAELAHQVHGAIGFSHEYPLHPLTRRLWSWRDEAGTESAWSARLGASLMAGRQTSLWRQISALQSDCF